jgi:drug/metabolite transporter (DMT)-like permease
MVAVEWALLFILAAMWGSSFLFNKIALRELPHFTLVCIRLILATTFLSLAAIALGHSLRLSGRVWRQLALTGFLNNFLPFNFTTYGQSHIGAGLAAILAASAPLFVVVLAHFLTRDEPMTTRKVGGVLAGMAGVAIIMGAAALDRIDTQLSAQLSMVCSAFSIALAGIYGRVLFGVPPIVSAAGQAACSMLMMIPVSLIADHPWELAMPSPATWACVVGLAAIGSGIAYVIFFHLLASAGATNVVLVNLLVPVSAVMLGVVFLGEHIEPRHFAGMLLIAAGLAAIDGRVLTWLRRIASGTPSP